MSDIVKHIPTATLAITPEDVKRYICPAASEKEVFQFLQIAHGFGLNPFKREVHLVKYGNSPASIVIGYEVYIKRAERTGKLNGWEVEASPDGKTATIRIYRKDWDRPFVWTVYRNEFDKGQANWKSMPSFMLRKVVIGQGFRLAFPDEMGGLPYLPEEISGETSQSLPEKEIDVTCEPEVEPLPANDANIAPPPPPPAEAKAPVASPPPAADAAPAAVEAPAEASGAPVDEEPFPLDDSEKVSDAQVKKIQTLFTNLGIKDRETKRSWVKTCLGLKQLESIKDLSKNEASRVIDALEAAEKQKGAA